MLSGKLKSGKRTCLSSMFEAVGAYHVGKMNDEDVKEYYLSKSPIRRGCTPDDVAKAIFYCVEQTFETGQAIPVTGGQTMLN